MQDKIHSGQHARLRWACRRGMLELDVILEPFLDSQYPSLSDTLQKDFEALLTFSDPELYAWLMKREAVTHKNLQLIVEQLHAFMQRPRS